MLISFAAAPVQCAAITVRAGWKTSDVTLDGKITTPKEWLEEASVDLHMLKNDRGPEAVESRSWFQNDNEWIYVMVRVPCAREKLDVNDSVLVAYLSQYNASQRKWESSDFGVISASNVTFDGWEWNGTHIRDDTRASPPGRNNVEGAFSNDGTYSWFEFRKALNSRDGRDWAFEAGQTIGS